MAGDGTFHTEFKIVCNVMQPGEVPSFSEMFADLRDEEPPSFLDAMQAIEVWRAKLGTEGDMNDVTTLEKFVAYKVWCWEQAEQQVKSGASSLHVDFLAALKMHCVGEMQPQCGTFMHSAIAADQMHRRHCSNADTLTRVLPHFKPYLWQLQSVLQGLPAYDDDQILYCELRIVGRTGAPRTGIEILWLTPVTATPSKKAVLARSRKKCGRIDHICKVKLTQLQARDISQHCNFLPGVMETAVLLPPGSTFRCESVEKDMENDCKCYSLIELPSQHWIVDLASSDEIDRSRKQFESQLASSYTGSRHCSEWEFLRPELQKELIIVLALLNAEYLCVLIGTQKSVGHLKKAAQTKAATRRSAADQESDDIVVIHNGQPLEDDRQRLCDVEPGLGANGIVNEMEVIIRSKKH